MSLLTIFIKGFSGLGVASTIPLSFAFHNETFSFSSRERLISSSPEPIKHLQQSSNQMDEMARMVQKEIGSTEHQVRIGCFATSGQHTPLLRETLYVCIDLGADEPEAFWFYYSWGRRSNISRGAYQITSITYKNSWQVTMNLKNEKGKQTVDISEKLRQWAGREFNPKSLCNVSKSQDKYTFTCGSGEKSFKQEIHRNNFYTTQTLSFS